MDPKTIREQAIRDAKVTLIFDAARKVFAEKGFHEARLEDIAASAGFSKASLYNYFEDKEQIFLSLAIRDFDVLLAELQKKLDSSAGVSIAVTIEYIFRTVFNFFGENLNFFLEASRYHCGIHHSADTAHPHHDELARTFYEKHMGLFKIFDTLLRASKEKGEIRCAIDESSLTRFIASLMKGIIIDWKLNTVKGDVEKTVQDLLQFTLYGLCYDQRQA